MSPADFTKLYVAYLEKSSPPGTEISVSDDLELRVGNGKKEPHSVFLENAYQQYLGDPDKRDEILEGYINSFLEVVSEATKQGDPDRIVPVVKDRGWLDEIRQAMIGRGKPEEEIPEYVSEIYNSELAVFYAEDSPKNIRYLTAEALEEMGICRENLRERALENLREILPQAEVMGGDGMYVIKAGGDYEASLLLLDELWDGGPLEVDGDFIVAIPSRDLLVVTGSGNVEGIERLRTMAAESAAMGSYRLTPVLFVRKNGKFEVFEG